MPAVVIMWAAQQSLNVRILDYVLWIKYYVYCSIRKYPELGSFMSRGWPIPDSQTKTSPLNYPKTLNKTAKHDNDSERDKKTSHDRQNRACFCCSSCKWMHTTHNFCNYPDQKMTMWHV